MRIWLIIDGTKQGPFTLQEILDRIHASELPATTYAWIEGMKEWKPIGEMENFRHEFEPRDEEEEAVEVRKTAPVTAPITAGLLWRRWAARVFDFTVWQSLCFGVTAAWGMPLKEWIYAGVFLLYVMPVWIPIEALMLYYFSWTPGKALLGLRVSNGDGSSLSIGTALIRSLRTFLMGMGAAYPPMTFFCHCFGWWFTRKNGIAIWDNPQKIQVTSKPLKWWRWLILAMTWFFASNILAVPAVPVMIEIMQERMPNHPFLKYINQ